MQTERGQLVSELGIRGRLNTIDEEMFDLIERRSPLTCQYRVFWSRESEPTEQEYASSAYLIERADSRYLEQYFELFYDATGNSITAYDEEVVSGTSLDILADVISKAIRETKLQPEEWPILTGYEYDIVKKKKGAPIITNASKSRLLRFLNRVSDMIRDARAGGGYVHFIGD